MAIHKSIAMNVRAEDAYVGAGEDVDHENNAVLASAYRTFADFLMCCIRLLWPDPVADGHRYELERVMILSAYFVRLERHWCSVPGSEMADGSVETGVDAADAAAVAVLYSNVDCFAHESGCLYLCHA